MSLRIINDVIFCGECGYRMMHSHFDDARTVEYIECRQCHQFAFRPFPKPDPDSVPARQPKPVQLDLFSKADLG